MHGGAVIERLREFKVEQGAAHVEDDLRRRALDQETLQHINDRLIHVAFRLLLQNSHDIQVLQAPLYHLWIAHCLLQDEAEAIDHIPNQLR